MRATLAFLATLVVLTRAYRKDKRQVAGPACIQQDIVYMLDSSQNIGTENFLQQLEFIKNNIKYYNINPSCTRVGIVTYSQGAYNQFYLNGYSTQQQLLNAIGNIAYTPGTTTNTASVINYVANTAFTTQHGARSGVPHYGILVTGSTSSSPTLTVSAANRARQNGVTFYTVGVGQGVNQGELSGVAGHSNNQFTASNFNSLDSLAAPVATRVNGAVTTASGGSMGAPSTCLQQADVVFLVDGSGSIGATNFVKLENFVKGIVGKLDVGSNKVHVGLVQFSNYPSKQFPLNMYTSRQDVMNGIQNMQYMGQGTNTADAIKYMRQNMFTQSGGARANVPRIGIVITDGRSANPTLTHSEADKARNDHISMMAIGVGNGVDVNELHNIADDPDSANTFQVSNYDQLDGIVSSIVNRACQVRATASPAVLSGTSAPGQLQPDTCQDARSDCASYGTTICHGTYEPWSKDNCARFCGHCHALYTTAPPPCADKLGNCDQYQSDSCVGQYKSWATENCRKFCGYCDASSQSFGFYGKCYYKGKQYSQGEKWDDGCDYECICENSQTGKYQCYNKCPVYYNLPSGCTLVQKPSECCLQPVCNFQPSFSSFEATMTGKTPDGTAVCVYKGQKYYQGQSWQDGCQYTCTCENAAVGTYKCQDSCPSYGSIPNYCHLEKKPGDCCSKPVCEFKTQTGSFSGMGTISGHGVGQSPTAPPPCVDVRSDCHLYETGFCDNYKPWARDNCRKTCNLCVENAPNPSATDVCMYEGQAFRQGQSWQVGCDTVCTCENAVYGYYRCVNSCPQYTNLPSGCTEVKKAGDCCTSVQCSNGKFYSSTGNLGSIGNGGLINVGNGGVQPTVPTGGVAPPGTGGTIYQAPTLKGCLYKGVVYSQGQIWEDGCEYTCQCEDSNTGLYTCRPKCPVFMNLPAECHLEKDPSDPCCERPQCQFTGTPVPVPPIYKPSMTGHNVVEPPIPSQLYHGTQTIVHQFTLPGNSPAPATSRPATITGHCIYKGQQYNQGQSWDDGCTYRCECLDGSTGYYRCRYICPQYTNLPPQCHLIQDTNNACCQVPNCTFPTQTTSITHYGTGPHLMTTPAPQPQTTRKINACFYKGHYYSQGQSWYDACDYKCFCDDSTSGYYRCTRRCPEYFNVPADCIYIPDPNDPTCCRVPQCTPTLPPAGFTGNYAGLIPTIPPGSFVGQPNSTAYVGFCDYKGTHYLSGDTWSDGCDYSCFCEDEEVGRYRCIEKCATYTALPPQCKLVPDFANPCCKRPDCNFNPSTGQFTGSGGQNPTPSPGSSPTPAPKPNVCVYKTAQYSQGQEWTDGCQYRCRCDDASRGLYVCYDRCPKYQTPLPPQCKMVTDPSDSCCQQPQCDFIPSIGQISGTIAPYMLPTKVPGYISGQANTPAPSPRPDGSYPSPQPLRFCEYKGSRYGQDQTWTDGCDYDCRCLNALQGRYECKEKCPKYTEIPPQCHLTKDAANPCCFKPVCDFPISAGQFTGHNTLAPIPGVSTIAPHLNPTPQPTPSLPSKVCVYRNNKYTQGQQWFDGCNFICECEDADRGIYRCTERCAKYTSLPAGCTLVADPQDPLCCEVPHCIPHTNTSVPYPVPPLGHKTGGYVTPAPPLKPGASPTPGSTLSPPLKGVCIYDGKQYTQGQRWQDGCDYNCVCQDANTGMYDCTEMCPKYTNLPPQCHLVQDVLQPCCKVPSCNHLASPTPGPGVSTIAPGIMPTAAPKPKAMCLYNGVAFKQGQTWDDGCDLQCVCEDETQGYYRCNRRCAVYPSVPAGCTLRTDPNDPCCQVPVCSPTPAPNPLSTIAPISGVSTPTPGPYLIPSLKPIIIGQGVTPTPKPGVSTAQPPVPVCVYYGVKYGQGEKWKVGCQSVCECTDAHTGQYKCEERCAIFPQIPANCRMVTDPADSCCKIPECSSTPAPNPLFSPTPQPGVSTLSPPLGPTAAPHPGTTLVPQPKQACVMNGVQYTPGQKWNDGCDKVCVCEDGTGHYTCSDRCKIYANVPKECTMVPDPADPLCCKVPQCIPVPGTNGVPTPGPTDKPVIYTNAPHAVVTGTGTPPTPTRAPTPAPQPGVSPSPGLTIAPLPRAEVCVYKGQQYLQGQKWADGCQYDCICEDGKTGRYKCTEKCGTYPNIPPQCTLQRDPNDYCCYVPVCDWSKTTPNPYLIPSQQPTLAPQPGVSTITPTPGINQTPAPNLAFCVYNGVPFKQGQILDDGCTQRCRCDDADTNYYNCYDRCPNYHVSSPNCVMVTDPQDSCCQIPKCTFVPTPGPTPYPPSLAPGASPSPYPTPSPLPTAVPGVIISKPNPTRTPQLRGFCQYNGIKYTKGQTWDDGCSYMCECLDDMTGQYKCTERCSRYPNIPSYCVMVEDPNDKCCKTPSCPGLIPTLAPNKTPSPIPGASPTPNPGSPGHMAQTPVPGQSTTLSPNPHFTQVPIPNPHPSPLPRDVCVMNGKSYTQGQQWYNGCQQTCICNDGKTGKYTCSPRCPVYNNIQPTCVFVPDPNDPICCQMPKCTTPNPNPSVAPTPAPKVDFCVYNGVPLKKGQTLSDGCDKVCRCEDPMMNTIVCDDRCATYPPLSAGCTLVTDPNDQCCQVPQCQPTTQCTGPNMPMTSSQPKGTITGSDLPKPNSGSQPLTSGKDVCLYKGVQHKTGATWDDGCDYSCVCIDGMTGTYKCTEKCAQYVNLPPNYKFVTDPKDKCCKIAVCDVKTTVQPSPQGTHGQSPTASPPLTPNPHGHGSTVSPLINPTQQPGHGSTVSPLINPTPQPGHGSTVSPFINPTQQPGHGSTVSPFINPTQQPGHGGTVSPPINPNPHITLNPGQNTGITGVWPPVTLNPDQNTGITGVWPPVTLNPGQNTGITGVWPPVTLNPGQNTGITGVWPPVTLNPGQNTGITGVWPPVTLNPGQNTGITGVWPPVTLNPGQNTGITGVWPPLTLNPGQNTGITGTWHPVTLNPGQNTGITGVWPPITIQPGQNTGIAGSNNPVTPTSFTGIRDQCVYRDMTLHRQGTTWQDGCDYTCYCDDPTTNAYRCTARCQIFSDLPSSCTLIPDPRDNCCKTPSCTGTLTPMIGGPTSGNPTLSPSVTNVVPIGTHTSFTGSGRPTIIPGMTSTGSRSVCYYKGTIHQQGESWDDGCDYTCTCTNAQTGLYSCTSKCPNYPAIPSYCKMNKIPGLCCPALSCNIPQLGNYNPAPQLIPTPAPSLAPGQTPAPNTNLQIYPGGTQPVIGGSQFPGGGYALPQGVTYGSIRSQCIYKNKLYNQGEKWDDGCDYQCECLDGKSGYYSCKPLCPTYHLPSGCHLKSVPGQCCNQPYCIAPGGTQINPLTNPTSQYPVYGSYNGGTTGFRPGYNPSYGSMYSVQGSSNRCIYNGRIYSQGQTWDDGCDYSCECTDAQHGQYTCKEKCQTYTSLPSSCRLVTLPGQCCQVPECNQSPSTTMNIPFTPSPAMTGCYDLLSNCNAYGQQSCQDPYKQWANKNCRAYCGFCQTTVAPTQGLCYDKLSNCQAYGQSACTGIYQPWASDNCKKFCNLCTSTPMPYVTGAPVTNSQIITGACADTISNCAEYGHSACVAPYEQWAEQNCRQYCGLCTKTGAQIPPTGQPYTTSWTIMMKGVAGVPGNLYQLWTSPNTSNENVPQAMYLTSTYPGHYKPGLSNYWNSMCIDMVKVAIFNQGVEKANIIFDATGADKNSWFDPNRIISSTWTDIKYAPKNLFSLLGDPSTGRQFNAGSSGSGCSSQGWMMVSTQNVCPFTQGAQKPAFYYAPGQTATTWGSTTPGTGDVFAILAHSTCNFGNGFTNAPISFTGTPNACYYKGKLYSQGQTWQDGCQFNCTCEDGKTGFFRCLDLCPLWNNLPAGCTLQKAAGECCSKPVCIGNSGVMFTNSSTANTCYYGNKFYHQGDKWRDGCKFSCECIDGTNGQYRCNDLCLVWNNLPSVCHMSPPAAGKCCSKPSCPSYVQLQYPPGYVEPDCATPCPTP